MSKQYKTLIDTKPEAPVSTDTDAIKNDLAQELVKAKELNKKLEDKLANTMTAADEVALEAKLKAEAEANKVVDKTNWVEVEYTDYAAGQLGPTWNKQYGNDLYHFTWGETTLVNPEGDAVDYFEAKFRTGKYSNPKYRAKNPDALAVTIDLGENLLPQEGDKTVVKVGM